MMTSSRPRNRRLPLLGSGVVSAWLLLLAAAGLWFALVLAPGLRARYWSDVGQSLTLRLDSIGAAVDAWALDGRRDAATAARFPTVVAILRASFPGPGPRPDLSKRSDLAELPGILSDFCALQGYRAALVVGLDGVEQLRGGAALPPMSDDMRAVAQAALAGGGGTEILAGSDGSPLALFTEPVRDPEDGRLLGAVVVLEDPGHWLHPFLATPPLPFPSSEVVLVRGLGSDVLYLSPVRWIPGPTFGMRLPLGTPGLLAAAAVERGDTLGTFRDYRDRPVIGAARGLAVAGWKLVAKVDETEALAPARREIESAGRSLLLGAGLLTTVGYLVWRGQSRRHQRTVKGLEARLRALSDKNVIGILAGELDGGIRAANEAFLRLVGRESGGIAPGGTGWPALVAPEFADRIGEAMAEVRARGAATPFEAQFVRPDGTRAWAVVGFALVEPGGRDLVAFVLDIARQKAAEDEVRGMVQELDLRVRVRTAELEAANAELEAFSYSVSHDLRAPLRAIEGFSRILLDDHASALGAEGGRLLGVVRQNVAGMSRLIDDLLEFSRAGRGVVRRSPVDMTTLARSIFFELTTPESRARIDLRLGELPRASADASLLRQVWANLLANAVKFSSGRERAVITVTGEIRDGACWYHVGDNGVGFDPRHAGKLFGVFERLHSAREFEGTGIGLALVRRIVHRHGGEVRAEGSPGGGARFSFSLPERGNDP